LGKEPFPFQPAAVNTCLETVDARGRLLVQAPTGSGKTLISQLVIAVLGSELRDRVLRALVVVPSRGLLAQHFFDAAWLRAQGVGGLHVLSSDLHPSLFAALLNGYGVYFTTPVTLKNRLTLSPSVLKTFDVTIFDEIDTYLTVDDLEERKDTWPLLEEILSTGVPVLGFTGTGLTDSQKEKWESRDFVPYAADVPADWMPRTRILFEGVDDEIVRSRDAEIREDLRDAFSRLETRGVVSWGDIKRMARYGDKNALAILRLCGQRLRLFESGGTNGEKYRRLTDHALRSSPCLVMTRYIDVAQEVSEHLARRVPTRQIDGQQPRETVRRGMEWFRARTVPDQAALTMTRDLGGRGLDFPEARSAAFISPRSNYQTVAQEVARIRSRARSLKDSVFFYYTGTEEQAKAYRLADHLKTHRYLGHSLFELEGVPNTFHLENFESRNLVFEESL
jgi:superfamily II DNA or RNA helicase